MEYGGVAWGREELGDVVGWGGTGREGGVVGVTVERKRGGVVGVTVDGWEGGRGYGQGIGVGDKVHLMGKARTRLLFPG